MAPPDVRGMGALCAAFVQAYDAVDASFLAPHLSEDALFVGLVADHAGAARVAHALFAGGERRACKPEPAFAAAPAADAPAGEERTYDMVIQSHALWPEQMYLDRVTVRDGKVVRIARRTLTSVAGGGVANFDGRDRYRLGGRGLSSAEASERVCYTWASERFLCGGFWDKLPGGAKECAKMCAALGAEPPAEGLPDEPEAVRAYAKAALLALKDNS